MIFLPRQPCIPWVWAVNPICCRNSLIRHPEVRSCCLVLQILVGFELSNWRIVWWFECVEVGNALGLVTYVKIASDFPVLRDLHHSSFPRREFILGEWGDYDLHVNSSLLSEYCNLFSQCICALIRLVTQGIWWIFVRIVSICKIGSRCWISIQPRHAVHLPVLHGLSLQYLHVLVHWLRCLGSNCLMLG